MPKITTEQKEALLEFMTAHHSKLFGKFSTDSGKALKSDLWNELLCRLNTLGPTKNIEQWKRVRCQIEFSLITMN